MRLEKRREDLEYFGYRVWSDLVGIFLIVMSRELFRVSSRGVKILNLSMGNLIGEVM